MNLRTALDVSNIKFTLAHVCTYDITKHKNREQKQELTYFLTYQMSRILQQIFSCYTATVKHHDTEYQLYI